MATDTKIAAPVLISTNPATGETVGTYSCTSVDEVHEAVDIARRAQPAWAALGVQKRVAIIRRFRKLLNQQAGEVAELITREAGKPIPEAMGAEILVVQDAAEFVARHAAEILQPQPVPHSNPAMKTKRGTLHHEPHGVIGIISPWNYPFSIPSTETLAALVLGNAVVLKPSELTPACALKLQSLLHEAGVPKEIMQVVLGEGPVGAALIDSKIDKIIFTGSVATGRRVSVAAAQKLLPCVLELGGKDPFIVFDDADLDVASSGAVWGAFMNAGQTCLSVERCYVQRSVFEKFVNMCVKKAQALKVGDGFDRDTDVGPMIDTRQLRIVESQVADALDKGAKVLTGGERLTQLGPNFYAPTVLTNVTPDMKLMREETFGPLLPVIPFDTDEQAISMANESEFGLAASVWTNSRSRGEAVAGKIEAGTVMVNDAISGFGICEAPHGGFKASGIGRTHGLLGMQEMVRVRYVDVDRVVMKKPWWYGYKGMYREQIHGFADMMFGHSPAKRIKGALNSTKILTRPKL
ncbi:Succinate-semialdehyde dehydrogenase (NAD(P)+) [Candidatus Koribacter versatilis Ellin345]|uniref:Aldehyde dehydrogenase n=1 Tax=Koribacter versatilis (strain Ellin345) TaxID=204669 RepID=Q1IRQ5_KORVE|nr:aldehyde dehydrogenase family protein [Candidatus Koribacter versatilis]ABF40445.1 Succinate-semialdehyde dehydrogenase (NAD(P)+) [Candidatus Koribacter versatilis Ellin345]